MVHTMASMQSCWASKAVDIRSLQLSSWQSCNISRFRQEPCSRFRTRSQVRCSFQDDFLTSREKFKEKAKDFNLPLQPKVVDENVALQSEVKTMEVVSAEEAKEALKAAKEKFGRTTVTKALQEAKRNFGKQGVALQSPVKTLADVSPEEAKEALKAAKEKFGRTTVRKALQEAKRTFGKQGVGKLALFGGVATLGVILSGAVLTSLELLPLVPEAMQTVGLAYSVLVASRMLRGKPETLTMSPVKAVIEIVDEGKKQKLQRTSLVLPQDLDEGTVAAMERLARERDMAVNQVEEMKRRTSEYSRILTEKEALETVALQLAEERETAVSEVNALKSAVESMTGRMKSIEQMLAREVGQLKLQNQALETVALQLAQERNSAIKEAEQINARSVAEKQALEEVAAKLAQERDSALSELESLKIIVSNMRGPAAGLTHGQELFMESRVQDIRAQLLDGHILPQEDINKLVSHGVDKFEVQPPSVGP